MIERYDPILATKHATQNPRGKNVPPHHLRCDWYRDQSRCQLGEGHPGHHKYAEAQHD